MVVAYVFDIAILCAEFLHARRLMYFHAMPETGGSQWQGGGVAVHFRGGLLHDSIFGIKYFVGAYVFDIAILCAEFLCASRLIYYHATTETGGSQ